MFTPSGPGPLLPKGFPYLLQCSSSFTHFRNFMDFCNGFSVMCAICRQREEVMKVKMPIKMQNSFFWIFTIFMLCGSHYGSLRRLCTPTLRKLTGCLIWNLRTGWNTLRCEFAALSQSLHPFLCFGSWH